MLEDTPYSNVELLSVVKAMHQITRFGKTKELSLLFSSDKSEKNEYITGILLVFMFLMAAGAIWFLILAILRLLGIRVGCASGRSANIPAEAMRDTKASTFDDTATEDSAEFVVMQADQNRINRIRVTFFVCGVCALVMAGLFVYSAIKVQLSFNGLYENAAEIQSLFSQIPQDLTHLDQAEAEFDTAKDSLTLGLVGFCQNSADISELASNLSQAFTNIDTGNTNSSFDWTHEVKDFITTIVNSLDFAQKPASVWFICSIAFIFLSILGTVFFLLLAWKSGNAGFEFVGEVESTRSYRLIRFVAFPLYVLLAFLTWFAASAVFAGTTVNADFCYDEISTGHGVHKILEEKGYDSNSDTYNVIDSYLHNCSDQDLGPIEGIEMYENNITDAAVLGQEFLELSGDELNICSDNNGTEIVTALATNATDLITKLQSKVLAIKIGISCEEIAPLVQNSVYQSSCQSLATNFMWAWLSLLGLAISCTLIITLRTATHRPQIYVVPPNEEIEPIDSYEGSRASRRV